MDGDGEHEAVWQSIAEPSYEEGWRISNVGAPEAEPAPALARRRRPVSPRRKRARPIHL